MSNVRLLRLLTKLPFYAEYRKAKLEKLYWSKYFTAKVNPSAEAYAELICICKKALLYERDLKGDL